MRTTLIYNDATTLRFMGYSSNLLSTPIPWEVLINFGHFHSCPVSDIEENIHNFGPRSNFV